jgi:4-hydroxy-tetrahydrodipicolinate synthase
MADAQIHGLMAAVLVPRHADGSLDVAGFRRFLEFAMQRGIFSFVINGATAEFCLTTAGQLREMLAVVKSVADDRATVLCGIGTAGMAQTLELARIGEQEGAAALLLPMPYFFPYEQDDLEAFCCSVASVVKTPILLYNLPQFTTGLEAETACRLIRDVPNIIGIKDSSGSLKILRSLTEQKIKACRILGHDGALAQAMEEGVCDGMISGIAGVFPEVIQAMFAHEHDRSSNEFRRATELVDEIISQLNRFPTPWALKWIAEARGIAPAVFSLPVSPRRANQARELMEIVPQWLARAAALSPAGTKDDPGRWLDVTED